MEDCTRKTLVKSEVINANVKLSQEKWDKLKVGEGLCVHIPDEIAPEWRKLINIRLIHTFPPSVFLKKKVLGLLPIPTQSHSVDEQ